MLTNFSNDLAIGRRGERIVYDYLKANNPELEISYIGAESAYFKKGDIRLVDKENNERFFEVKNDSRIHQTNNVLCEDYVEYFETNETKEGFMHNDYDLLCIVSEASRRLYLLDFAIVKKLYKQGIYKYMAYSEQASHTYLLSLKTIENNNGIVAIANY